MEVSEYSSTKTATSGNVCGKCGSKILADAPQGLCSLCLFKSAIGSLTTEADEPFGLSAAQINFDDYELLQEIGRGGQGVVYRARQKSLNRTVALKVIGVGSWATEAHLKRFRLEAEAAASLNHPFIVPIHEIGERGGYCYFSMNLIDGGQLDEVVKCATADSSRGEREPLPIRRASELIAKLARTVHYAHEHGIVHRDIKPGNILLDKEGEPHLTDFGLARLVETESNVTRTTDVLGTPSYMAPEQASGNNAEITSATDIYALGAVFYQLLTGRVPFLGRTAYETVRLVLETEPRQPRLVNPKVDRDLSTICLKCLEKDPKRRYTSALALAEDLERWLRREPIHARRTGFVFRGRKWLQRNPATAVSIAALAALVVAVGVIIGKSDFTRPVPATGIAVMPFENLSQDTDNAYFAVAMQNEILTRLAKIGALKIISRASTQAYPSKPGNLREIGNQLDVSHILEGSVQKAGDGVHITVQLVRAATDDEVWAETYNRKLDDIFSVEGEVAGAIADALNTKLTGTEKKALTLNPTTNASAYNAYLRGVAIEAQHYGYVATREAAADYSEAVHLDPGFALAWARLAIAQSFLCFHGIDLSSNSPGAVQQAADTARALQPNMSEAWIAQGYYLYRVRRDFNGAIQAFREAHQRTPGSVDALMGMGIVERRLGLFDEARAHFDQALRLDPRNVTIMALEAAMVFAPRRRFPEAHALLDRALRITPGNLDLLVDKAYYYQSEGRLEDAAKQIAQMPEDSSDDGVIQVRVNQLIYERQFDQAIAMIQKETSLSPSAESLSRLRKTLLSQLGYCEEWAGRPADARATFEHSIQTIKPSPSSTVPVDEAGLPMALALSYAGVGDKEAALQQARQAIEEYQNDVQNRAQAEVVLAQIEARFGDLNSAILTLPHLLEIPFGITRGVLQIDPMWDPLRQDSRFQKILTDLAANEMAIAVLPFENLGSKENAFFADGIHDEILTSLARTTDLKVISRTSVMQYKGQLAQNLRQIAEDLGVAYVLEGSVQRAPNRVHVNVQLIDVRSDVHIWAQTYDRTLDDILNVETEIAADIAKALNTKLTTSESSTQKPTNNSAAYDAYLRGLALEPRGWYSAEAKQTLRRYYAEAVKLDPQFVAAWARLARIDSLIFFLGDDSTHERRNAAGHALASAMKLQPDSTDTLFAQGYYEYWVEGDYAKARDSFTQLRNRLPNNSEVFWALGLVARRQGLWDECLHYTDQALTFDPRNPQLLINHAWTYTMLRRFDDALKISDRVLTISPGDADAIAYKAAIFHAQGKQDEARHLLDEVHLDFNNDSLTGILIQNWLLVRDYQKLIETLQPAVGDLAISATTRAFYRETIGFAQLRSGDKAAATQTLLQARNEFELLRQRDSNSPELAGHLATVNACLGEKEIALQDAAKAVALRTSSQDPVLGPALEENLARVEAEVNENETAIARLQKLLQTPYSAVSHTAPITPALLRLHPYWDPLRGDPRFEKIVNSLAPK